MTVYIKTKLSRFNYGNSLYYIVIGPVVIYIRLDNNPYGYTQVVAKNY